MHRFFHDLFWELRETAIAIGTFAIALLPWLYYELRLDRVRRAGHVQAAWRIEQKLGGWKFWALAVALFFGGGLFLRFVFL